LSDGRRLGLSIVGQAKDTVIGRLAGVSDRTAAEALKGAQLFVDRAALPEPEDGYYHADLIGLAVVLTSGERRGQVAAVLNFGAGDILEVARPDGDTEFIPFSAAAIAAVDVAGGTVTVNPLPGLFDDEEGSADVKTP
jgi:16S rRNA processing protein RimM